MGSVPSLVFVGGLLGGSWVVISRVVSPLISVYKYSYLTYEPLITTHEPPSRVEDFGV